MFSFVVLMDGLSSLVLALSMFASIIFIAHILIKRSLRDIKYSEESKS